MLGKLALKVLECRSYRTTSPGRAEIFCSDIFLENELKPESHLGSGRPYAGRREGAGWLQRELFVLHHSFGSRAQPEPVPSGAVIEEIAALVDRGYKEVVLSGIHLGTYGGI